MRRRAFRRSSPSMRNRILVTVSAALVAAAPGGAQAQERRLESDPPVAFWQTVGDSTLDRLIADALVANRDLRAVEARVSEARASRSEARLDLAPTVTMSAGYSRQRMASATFPGAGRLPDQNVWDTGLQMSWELDVFGRLRRSLQGRSELLASAEEDVRDVQVVLAAEVARSYYDLRGAQNRLAVARRNAENQQRTLVLTQDRMELGRGSGVDIERAQAQLSSTLATIPTLEAEIEAVQHRIAVLLGQSPASLSIASAEETCPMPLPELDVGDVAERVRERPDVRSAQRQLSASKAFVGAAKADYLPRISIGAVAGYTADAFDALGNSGTPRYAIGPVISWPFLDLGRVRTRVDAARAGESEASARLEQTVLRAEEELRTALTSYARSRQRLAHLEDAADASQRAAELVRLRFEEGVTDFLEVLDAERRLLEAQDRLAAGRTEATNWLVAVYRASGG